MFSFFHMSISRRSLSERTAVVSVLLSKKEKSWPWLMTALTTPKDNLSPKSNPFYNCAIVHLCFLWICSRNNLKSLAKWAFICRARALLIWKYIQVLKAALTEQKHIITHRPLALAKNSTEVIGSLINFSTGCTCFETVHPSKDLRYFRTVLRQGQKVTLWNEG